MNEAGSWEALAAALDKWSASGRRPVFWLRDDDAVAPTAALDRLLALAERFEVPLALAVIPAHAGAALAGRLADDRLVTVLVHGWSHENHAPADQKKQELGLHRPPGIVLEELTRSLERVETLFSGRAAPILVPPWNRIDAALVPELGRIGYRALSVYGRPKPAPLPLVNTTVDIIDWHGTRGCREQAQIVGEIVSQLDAGLAEPDAPPVGLLTHHLVHDEAAWKFLEALFALTTRSGIARWKTVGALLPD
jgi:peptidoglycan/xylan/chitin deacetylase (PgdA/CDA1 family)